MVRQTRHSVNDPIDWSEYSWPAIDVTYSRGQRLVNFFGPPLLGIVIGAVLGYVVVAVLGG